YRRVYVPSYQTPLRIGFWFGHNHTMALPTTILPRCSIVSTSSPLPQTHLVSTFYSDISVARRYTVRRFQSHLAYHTGRIQSYPHNHLPDTKLHHRLGLSKSR